MNDSTYETPLLFSGDVLSNLADMEKRHAAKMNDPMLSEVGRQKTAEQHQAEKQAAAPKALNKFAMDWDAMKTAYVDLKAKREAIAETAAKQWDYVRLSYERQTAHGVINATQSPQELAQAYEAVKLSGDRHAMRAFAETAASVIGASKHYTDKAGQIEVKQAMQREAAKLTSTPEMVNQLADETKLSNDIIKLYNATQQAASDFYPAYTILSMGSDPFRQLLDGVKVTERVDPATLETKTSIDVNWE